MATYRDTKGYTIETVTADPVPGLRAWSSGGNVNEARYGSAGGGTPTAAFIASGYASSVTVNHEQYDGTTWTELANLAVGRNHIGGAGIATAALAFGGWIDPGFSTATESWNGTSWTELANMATGRYGGGPFGTNTAAIYASGIQGPAHSLSTAVEEWNGSAWSEVAELNSSRQATGASCTGIVTAGAVIGGSPEVTAVEQWNGTGWTETADINVGRAAGMASGSNTVCIYAGGSSTANVATAETFDGTSWTTNSAQMTTARQNSGTGHYASSSTATFVASGQIAGSPDVTTVTEEWGDDSPYAAATVAQEGEMWYNSTSDALKVFGKGSQVPSVAWASGGSLNQLRGNFFGGAGSSTAGIVMGGYTGSAKLALVETYDGSTWTEVGDLDTATSGQQGTGTQTAALSISGAIDPGLTGVVESYNGTAWTEVAEVTTARQAAAGFGTQTSSILATGATPPATPAVESFNGTAWTEVAEVNTARINTGGFGSDNTNGVVVAGTPNSNLCESWNGTAWTETTEVNTGRAGFSSSGSSNVNGIIFGGDSPLTGKTEFWNGSSWTELGDMTTARNQMGQSVGQSSVGGLACGGNDAVPTQVAIVEEWVVTQSATTTVTVS